MAPGDRLKNFGKKIGDGLNFDGLFDGDGRPLRDDQNNKSSIFSNLADNTGVNAMLGTFATGGHNANAKPAPTGGQMTRPGAGHAGGGGGCGSGCGGCGCKEDKRTDYQKLSCAGKCEYKKYMDTNCMAYDACSKWRKGAYKKTSSTKKKTTTKKGKYTAAQKKAFAEGKAACAAKK